LHRVAGPGAAPEPLTDHADPVSGGRYEPRAGNWILFTRGTGGDEVYRIHRLDAATGQSTPVSPEGRRASAPAWNRKGDRIVFTTVAVDRFSASREARTTLHLADPLAPEKARILADLPGGGWSDFHFSPDDRRLAFIEYVSAQESHVWLMDVATAKRRRLTPSTKGAPVYYDRPQFAPDGKSLFVISDRGSEFRHVAVIDIASGRERALATNLKFDVENIAVSVPARRLAFVTNEAGAHELRLIDTATRKETPRPALVPGVISGMRWRRDGSELAFTHATSRSPGDVFSYDLREHRVTRWTNGNSPALNAAAFPEPRVIRWKSFDGREITGLYYHPPSRFEGVRPVVVSVHGGPASQARAGFIGRNNYLVNKLGVALIYPNVRGSSGFGKTFLGLDNGRLREDSVKDLGALLDWIAAQPGLDAGRVLVTGGSYGGYMALAASVRYAHRIAGAVSVVGISNFVTFLERTETYRRDLRRVEYGDERDPAMREFLESISPLAHAARIAKPLFVVQGKNDPRVPWTESEQIVATLKKNGTPAWYLLANDEGHGFRKKANADFQFNATVEFIRRTLNP
jgi:dipeptidyl aminopeptidase/acylaminoacyl peptidase